MKIKQSVGLRVVVLISLLVSLTLLSSKMKADTGNCGGASVTLPFTDVGSSPFFCQIAAAYFSGLTNGTTATTYSPTQTVTREQMAAFITRTQDSALRRGSRRAALNQWWTPTPTGLAQTTVGDYPRFARSDGQDIWVSNVISGTVMRVRASDGRLLETWTGVDGAEGVLVAQGRVFVIGDTNPGKLYVIDPRQPAGTGIPLTSSLGNGPAGIAFDGEYVWTATINGGSVLKIDPVTGAVQNSSRGYSGPFGVLYDGANIWVTDLGDNTLKKVNSNTSIALSLPVGATPAIPVFDGMNIWVPNQSSNSVTVVRVKDSQGNPLATPFVLTTLTGNGLMTPTTAAFDGQRILVTNLLGNSVSLWKATDLTPLGSFSTGANSMPWGACSDGVNFWVTLSGTDKLLRF